MAENSQSDVESDNEFEELLSSHKQRRHSIFDGFVVTVRFWGANGYAQGVISKNRFLLITP